MPEPIDEGFGVSGFVTTDDGVIVMGEPHVAATWFPANDHPRDKAQFHFRITVPKGLEAIANGVLVRKSTSSRWSTWEWDAREPMATYLATMAVGQFDVDKYRANGIRFWDAIDTSLLEDLVAEATPTKGSQMLSSDVGEPSYKRLTRLIAVPPGGSTLTFDATQGHRDRVGLRVRGGSHGRRQRLDDLADANGHTNQEVGACPGPLEANPFRPLPDGVRRQPGDPTTPEDDELSCMPTGLSGTERHQWTE